jgi:hypothetical protein
MRKENRCPTTLDGKAAGSKRILFAEQRYRKRYSQFDARAGAIRSEPASRVNSDYWWRCFMAAAQRIIKKPIHKAARWNGMAS